MLGTISNLNIIFIRFVAPTK